MPHSIIFHLHDRNKFTVFLDDPTRIVNGSFTRKAKRSKKTGTTVEIAVEATIVPFKGDYSFTAYGRHQDIQFYNFQRLVDVVANGGNSWQNLLEMAGKSVAEIKQKYGYMNDDAAAKFQISCDEAVLAKNSFETAMRAKLSSLGISIPY